MIDHLDHNFGTTARSDTTINSRRGKTVPSRMAALTYLLKGFLIGGREDLFRSDFLEFCMESVDCLVPFGHSRTSESGPRGFLEVLEPESDPQIFKIIFRKTLKRFATSISTFRAEIVFHIPRTFTSPGVRAYSLELANFIFTSCPLATSSNFRTTLGCTNILEDTTISR